MDITFIQLPDGYDSYTGRYPLGVAYIAAPLVKAGHRVQMLDFKFFPHTRTEIENKIKDIQADLIGLSGMISSYAHIKEISHWVRQYHPEVPLVLGGPISFTIEPLLLQHNSLDAICVGEGEQTMFELVTAMDQGNSWEHVAGLWLPDGNGGNLTLPRTQIEDLDSLAFPAWDSIPPEPYWRHPLQPEKNIPMSVLASRGCPASCDFCARVVLDRSIRYRSVANVMDELRMLRYEYGIRQITFVDEYLTANLKWLRSLCQQLIDENLGITWNASSRVRLFDDITYDFFQASGCHCLSYGVESANPDILRHYNKRQRSGDTLKIFQKLNARGITMNYLLINGDFDETEETLRDTVDILLPQGTAARLHYLTPLPGTPIYRQAIEKGLIQDEDRYLMDLSLIDNSFESIPTINLTRFPQKEWMGIKETAEKDTRLMNILRNVVGVFGEQTIKVLLNLKDQQMVTAGWRGLCDAWQTYLDYIRYLKHKYPYIQLDICFYSQNPGIPAIEYHGELPPAPPKADSLDYFMTEYGTLGEYFLVSLLGMTANQVATNFENLQYQLKQDLALFYQLQADHQGEFVPFGLQVEVKQHPA